MKSLRHSHGALTLETIESKPVFDGDQIRSLEVEEKNRAKEIIEDFMIAANRCPVFVFKEFSVFKAGGANPKTLGTDRGNCQCSRYKAAHQSGFERTGTIPSKNKLPIPCGFQTYPGGYQLLGAGEYVAELPMTKSRHFGLAVKDYSHSTAPNRRFPGLITQRLLKAAIEGNALPYTKDELLKHPAHLLYKARHSPQLLLLISVV